VASGVTESVERGDNDNGDSNDQKSVFGCVLTGFLAPEAFERRDHLYGTFENGGDLVAKGWVRV
jgi:hypothetical protein